MTSMYYLLSLIKRLHNRFVKQPYDIHALLIIVIKHLYPKHVKQVYDLNTLLIIFEKRLHRQNVNQSYDPNALLMQVKTGLLLRTICEYFPFSASMQLPHLQPPEDNRLGCNKV